MILLIDSISIELDSIWLASDWFVIIRSVKSMIDW